jgi:hypothetical protein
MPTQGSVKVFGQVLEGINRCAGYMFQSEALMPWRSAIGWRWQSRWFVTVFFNVYPGVKEVSPVVLANARMLGG